MQGQCNYVYNSHKKGSTRPYGECWTMCGRKAHWEIQSETGCLQYCKRHKVIVARQILELNYEHFKPAPFAKWKELEWNHLVGRLSM